MLLCAINFELALQREFPYVALGALSFCISDSLIAWNLLQPEVSHISEAFVLLTYYTAQVHHPHSQFNCTYKEKERKRERKKKERE
jgi:hypothetical protein